MANPAPPLVERRTTPTHTENCPQHEKRMDEIDKDINQQKGWFRAAAGFWGVAILVVGFLGTAINSKLGNIEVMLTTDKSDIRMLTEQMKNAQSDIVELRIWSKEHDKNLMKGIAK